jgi:hypothetical protein
MGCGRGSSPPQCMGSAVNGPEACTCETKRTRLEDRVQKLEAMVTGLLDRERRGAFQVMTKEQGQWDIAIAANRDRDEA